MNELITLIITNFPSFLGFILLAVFSWKIIDRQMIIIERLTENCVSDLSQDSESMRQQYKYNQQKSGTDKAVG